LKGTDQEKRKVGGGYAFSFDAQVKIESRKNQTRRQKEISRKKKVYFPPLKKEGDRERSIEGREGRRASISPEKKALRGGKKTSGLGGEESKFSSPIISRGVNEEERGKRAHPYHIFQKKKEGEVRRGSEKEGSSFLRHQQMGKRKKKKFSHFMKGRRSKGQEKNSSPEEISIFLREGGRAITPGGARCSSWGGWGGGCGGGKGR